MTADARASRAATGSPGASLSDRERALIAAVDPARVEADLRAVVAVPSVTGDEGPVQDLMAALMAEAGLAVERVETDPAALATDPDFPGVEMPRDRLPVVAGRIRGARPGPRMLIVAHVDVVPPGDPSTWTTPAFTPDVRDGDLYGRGANDMKGGVVAGLAAIRALAAAVDPAGLAGEAVFVTVPAEEDGGAGMLAAIRAGYVGEMAVITEPTNLDIVVTQAGAITFRLIVPGKAAHASMRRHGVSALEKLEVLHAALRADETARNEAETDPRMRALGLPYPTIIGRVSGGDWASTVPDRIVAEGRYGVRAGQTSEEAEADLRRCIEAASAARPVPARPPRRRRGLRRALRLRSCRPRRAAGDRAPRHGGGGRRATPELHRRALWRRYAPAGQRGRHADRHLRARRPALCPRRRRARAARPGRPLRPRPGGLARPPPE